MENKFKLRSVRPDPVPTHKNLPYRYKIDYLKFKKLTSYR